MKANTASGFEEVKKSEPIPFQRFVAIMENTHRMIGTAIFLSENSRSLILGYLEGQMAQEGCSEPVGSRAERRTLLYALSRCEGHAGRSDITNAQVKEKILEELTPILKRPTKGKNENTRD